MKILAIRGRNLASLAGGFEVDLTAGALGGAGVFAITGPVGSGKSTLLDALCLALYNRTPRFSQSGGVPIGRADTDDKLRLRSTDVRSVLRKGTSSGHAEVDFRGVDDVAYRARWSVRRARDKVDGAVQHQDLTLHELEGGLRIGGTNTEVLEAIRARVGLSFGQFCRSALLAQGDFARFLESDERERAELLERMTGTEIYGRLSMAAFARRRESQSELASLRERLGELIVLSDDERAGLAAERETLQAEFTRIESERLAIEQAIQWYSDRDRLQGEETKAAAVVERRAAAIAEHETRSADGSRVFAAELERLHREIEAECAAERAELDEVAQWLAGHEHRRSLSRGWDRWSSVLFRYRESAAATRRIEEERRDEERRATATREASVRAEQARDAAAVAADEAMDAHKAAGAALDAADPDELVDRLAAIDAELERLRGAEARFAAMTRAVQDEKHARDRAQRASAAADSAGEQAKVSESELQKVAAQRAEADRALRQAELIMSLEEHRDALEDGEPCPLCGSTEHPLRARHEAAAEKLQSELAARSARLREAESGLRAAAQRAAHEHRTQSGLAAEATREAEGHRRKSERERDAVADRFGSLEAVHGRLAERFVQRDAVVEEQRRVAAMQRTARLAAEVAERRRQVWLEAKDECDARERQRREADIAVERAAEKLQHHESARAQTVAELAAVFDEERTPEWRRELAVDPDGFVRACERAAERFARAEDRHAELTGSVECRRRLLQAVQALGEESSEANFATTLAVVRQAALPRSRTLAELLQREVRRRELHRQAAASFATELSEARTVLAERRRNREEHGRRKPAREPEEVRASLAAIRAEQESIRDRRDSVLYGLRRDDETRARATELRARIAGKQKSTRCRDELAELIGSFDGRSFRAYAQSLTLDGLLASANHHLEDLAPRYRLQRVPGHDLDLQVVDLDMGEDVRPVNSLSGGESFLVSLALALGLSSISAATTRVDSLFIDEGFGMLDMQTLDSALATLDALQATGRQVGIISHVAGIAERIGAQVVVAPAGSGRSNVLVAEAW